MKKTYITPSLKVKKIKIHNILAGSTVQGSIGAEVSEGGALSKQGNGFDWGDANPDDENQDQY